MSVKWLDGAMAAVLPDEYASRPLVLLPPSAADRACTASGLHTETLQCLRCRPRPTAPLSHGAALASVRR